MVLTDSHGISRAPCYLGYSPRAVHNITVTGLTPSTAGLSRPFTYASTSHPTVPAETARKVPQPRPCNARRLSHMERFSLIRVRSPLLTESLLFSLPAGTEMFHFPAFPPRTLCVQMRVTRSHEASGGVSPFGHPGITVRLSTPPGLSQIPTSFFGS